MNSKIHTDVSLKKYTTMRLGGHAKFMAEASSSDDLANICRKAHTEKTPIFILGQGSNVIAHDEGYNGIVIINRIPGLEIITDNNEYIDVKIGAGEDWGTVVKRAVDLNLSGIEAMSGIPGTAGAGPVQNVGAFGQEICDTLISLTAYDIPNDCFVELSNEDCEFSYRHSIFRGSQKGRYAITSIVLRLSKSSPRPPFYSAIQKQLDDQNIDTVTSKIISDIVLAIRKDKLPNPSEKPNSGSFFKNSIVEKDKLESIKAEFPDVPFFDMPDGKFKIPTGWLIEKVGLKGQLLYGMKIHDKNALILINESANGYSDLAKAREEIIKLVHKTFGITIEQEPLEI